MTWRRIAPAVVVAALFCCRAALPQEGGRWHVSAEKGNDAADGRTPESAFKTLARGIKALKAGDTLVVGPGTYYEGPIVLEDLKGSPEKPTCILAEPRGMATVTAAWKEAALGKVKWEAAGDGIYSAPKQHPALFCWLDGGRFLMRFMKLDHLKAAKVPTTGSAGIVNVPEHGFAWENGKTYLKLPGGEDPNGKPVMFSLPSWGEPSAAPVVRVNSSPHIVIDGLRIQGTGTYGIQFGAPNATVRNCIFEYCREGVGFTSDSLIEWCEFSYPGLYDLAEETKKRNNGRISVYPITKEYYPHNWWEGSLAYAVSGEKDPAPKRVEVRYCYAHQVFDGLVLGSFDDSEAHHNVFLHCYDNCVEMETWTDNHSRNLKFHHNLLLSCPGGPMSHQYCSEKQKLEGPHYVYRNVICGYDDHGWSPWVVIKSKCRDIKGMHYYHNLVLVESAEPFWNEKAWPQDWVKNLDFRNNIFIFKKQMKRPTGPRTPEALAFTASNNIVVAGQTNDEAFREKLSGAGGLLLPDMAAVKLRDPDKLDFALQPGSPAVDAGAKIPGFNDDAKGAAPDIGPFEADETPGPDWPRPRKTAFDGNPPEAVSGKKLPPKVVVFEGK